MFCWQVLNFYELRTHTLLRTIPILEELEAVLFLDQKHSHQLLAHTVHASSAAQHTHVVVTAGEKGILKLFVVSMKVMVAIDLLFVHLSNCGTFLHRSVIRSRSPSIPFYTSLSR